MEAYPSPVVEVNRAVAHGRAYGPDAGLAIVDAVSANPSLTGTSLAGGVRGDLLERRGDDEAAAAAFREAAGQTGNEAERQLLLRRATKCFPESV